MEPELSLPLYKKSRPKAENSGDHCVGLRALWDQPLPWRGTKHMILNYCLGIFYNLFYL